MSILFQRDELMSKPGDGVGLSAARAVLNEIPLTDTILLNICKELFHHVELMIAREYLSDFFLLCFSFGGLHNLRVILNDTTELFLGKDILPEVVGHDAVGIWRVARTILVAFIEGKEPAILAGETGTEFHMSVIYGEMHHAALELEQKLVWITIRFVLLHRVVHVLLGKLVF